MSCDQVTRCLNAENQAKMGNTENTNNFKQNAAYAASGYKRSFKGK